ncbi:unnamed protein product [Auanema sp. JU1783]|nr:unnamed protein product [Auanema sp. JU1783]
MLNLRNLIWIRRFSSVNSYALRTHTCGELSLKNEGEKVKLMGWLAYKRMNKFLVLRDSYGMVQVTVPANQYEDLPYESVVQVEGIVRSRGDHANPNMKTGEIEVDALNMEVLNRSESNLPLLPNEDVNEKTRLRYRYLDIRGDKMQKSLRVRSTLVHEMRRFLIEQRHFVDVETPTLFRRTPGGAAEFLVPSSAPNLGLCYSLPQSPQQFKQLLMVGGIDRYFQIARCYRDEGSKGDRQPEFTQVDLELSFTNQEEVMRLVEDLICSSWPEHLKDLQPTGPFPHLSYEDAMKLYGSDKPDMRIPWKIQDATSQLGFLKGEKGGLNWRAKLIVCKDHKKVLSGSFRKEAKRLLEVNDKCSAFDMYSTDKKQWFKQINNENIMEDFDIGTDDLVIFAWGEEENVGWTLGQLRNYVAEKSGLRKARKITFHWIVDFPLFTVENEKLVSTHHPFTAPIPEHELMLNESENRNSIKGQHYDLVINGVEMGGGSIRIHDPKQQELVLDILGEKSSEMAHLLKALSYGAPPHGGFALGLDRYVAFLVGEGDPTVPVREVIAFPKTKEGKDLMSLAPAPPSEADCNRYGFRMFKE